MLETFELSNDAFYYLKDGEEPLIDEAIEEAEAIEAMFPEGYTIFTYKPLGTTGYIEATIGPKIKAPIQARLIHESAPGYDIEAVTRNKQNYYDSDATLLLSNIFRVEIVWLDEAHTKLKAYKHRLDLGERVFWDNFDVETTARGLKYIRKNYGTKGARTQLFLRDFKPVIK